MPPSKRHLALLSLQALLLCSRAGAAPSLAAQDEARRAQAQKLFLANCAPCHGENGDGHGTTVLDRPARSFQDGGFSYGNTPEALYRSITTGIPGTPMPAFGAAVSEDERRALADYVRSLGPNDGIAETPDRVLVVQDRPRIIRGKLPPVLEGKPERPRGLLLGLTSGTSFEYRSDDVRLLAVRQGEFVERRDWGGRGGDALQPLGAVVHLLGQGDPEATFLEILPRDPEHPFGMPSGKERELMAELQSSWVRGTDIGLSQRVRNGPGGPIYAVVEESLASRATSVGSGWSRRFRYRGDSATVRVLHRFADDFPPEARAAALVQSGAGELRGAENRSWFVYKRPNGGYEARGLLVPRAPTPVRSSSASAVWLELTPGAAAEVEVTTILLPAWSAEIQAKLFQELPLQ